MLFHFTGDSGYFTLGLGPLANPDILLSIFFFP